MISFGIPEKLNGAQLLQELETAGIISDIPMIADDLLWLTITKAQESAAKTIVNNHVGVDTVPTFEEKLASAGISLDELKTALGL